MADLSQYFNDDCVVVLSNMEDSSVDLIIADPPYYGVAGEFDFVWTSKQEYLDWCFVWLQECARVLKDSGTMMLWGGIGKKMMMMPRLAILIEDNELFIRQNWITQRNTRGIGSRKNYMSTREELLFLTKTENYTFNIPYTEEKSIRKDLGANGKPRKNSFKRVSNVWMDITEASQSSTERCFHPTVKAQKLCSRIINTHSNSGDLVFIPFAGSGSEIISCINLDRRFIASELDTDFYNQSIVRINSFISR